MSADFEHALLTSREALHVAMCRSLGIEPAPLETAFVYCMESKSLGLTKIGFTASDVRRRHRNVMLYQNPTDGILADLRVVAVFEFRHAGVAYAFEGVMIDHFARRGGRSGGDWFVLSPTDLDWIFGEASELAFFVGSWCPSGIDVSTCRRCGQLFLARGPRHVLCSDACRVMEREERKAERARCRA